MLEYSYHPIYKYLTILVIVWIIFTSNKYIPKHQIAGLAVVTILVVFSADTFFIKNHESVFESTDFFSDSSSGDKNDKKIKESLSEITADPEILEDVLKEYNN